MGNYHIDITTDKPMVLLASYPRSGNTFVRQVLYEAFALPTFTLYPQEDVTEEYGGWIGDADFTGLPVVIIKTHDMLQDWWGKVWHVVRDGRDAVSSYRKYKRNSTMHSGCQWAQRVSQFEEIADHTTRYEDLIAEPIDTVRRGLQALGFDLPVVSRDLTRFDKLQEQDSEMWRRGIVGSWVDEMADVEQFCRVNGSMLRRLEYA